MAGEPLAIAVIVNLYPPYVVGGNEILAQAVVAALRARGHTIHVLTGHGRLLPQDGLTHQVLDIDLDRKQEIFLGGLPLTLARVVQWHLYNHASYRGVRAALQRIEPDLVVAWNLYMASAAPLIAARRLPYPLVAQPADKWLLYMLNDITRLIPGVRPHHRMAMRLLKHLVQPILFRAGAPDYLLCVSEFIRQLHLDAGYAPQQSCATHLGIPLDKFPFRERQFPDKRTWRLLFVGQLWEGKGAQVAIEAVKLLSERDDVAPVELDIFGSGSADFERTLRTLIETHNLNRTVRLRGFVSHEQLRDEFHEHDIYLFCSVWDEPFSGGLLEAMATGIPTIATSAGGTPEAVADGVNGLLTPPNQPLALADAVVRLMRDPLLWQRIGRQAAADVQRRWGFEEYIDRLESAYRSVADSPPRPELLDISCG